MAEQYPCGLPPFKVAGAGYFLNDLVEQNDLSSGPPVFRTRSDDGWMGYNGSFSFSALENQAFRNWFKNTIRHGGKSFEMELMIDGFDGTKNTVTALCYMQSPQWSQNGRRWSVSCNLIVVSYKDLDECDTESLISTINGFENPNLAIDQMQLINDTLSDLWAV